MSTRYVGEYGRSSHDRPVNAYSRKGGVRYLVHHLLGKVHENEKIEVLAGDRHALDDAQALARLKGCRYSVRHLSISPQREMTPRQLSAFLRAIDTEFKVGLERQCLVVRHVKNGRSHFYMSVSEVDLVTLRVLDCRRDFARLENLARCYEADNGEQVQPTRAERRTQRAEGFSDVARKRAERSAPKFDWTKLRQAARRGRAAFLREIDRQSLRTENGDKGAILVTTDGVFVAAACRAAGMKRGEFQSFLQGGNTNEQLIGSQTRVPSRTSKATQRGSCRFYRCWKRRNNPIDWPNFWKCSVSSWIRSANRPSR